MASSINAITTGSGGVITTADNSGDLNIQSGGSTKIAVTSAGVAVTGTFTANGTAVTSSQWTTSGSDISYSAGNVSLGANIYSGGGIKSFNITGTYPTIALYDNTNTLRYTVIASAAQTEFNSGIYKFANANGSTEYMRLTTTGQASISAGGSPISAGWLTLYYDGQNYNGLMVRT